MLKGNTNQEGQSSNDKEVTRRSFLKSSAMIGGCLAASVYLTRYAQGAEARLSWAQDVAGQGGSP